MSADGGPVKVRSTVVVSRQDAHAARAARAIEEGAVRALRHLFGRVRSDGMALDPATLKLEVRLTEYGVVTPREGYVIRATMEVAP